MSKKYIITKRIAKHGNQLVIVIPQILQYFLKAGTIAKITIDVIKEKEK